VAVVMPVLNEADGLEAAVRALSGLDLQEIVIVDGGSTDATPAIARDLALAKDLVVPIRVVQSLVGRARQMNRGADGASADVLLFLHADTLLPPGAVDSIRAAIREGLTWGRFDVRLDGQHTLFRCIERLMNLRSALTGIATGDQAMFALRETFAMLGGFAPLPLMEDIDLSRRLKWTGPPAILRTPVVTSARRWQAGGIWRTVLGMWTLRLFYSLGVAPERLAESYRQVR
jgi:rSAM/selenodomain-associated transferase 2